MTDRKSLFLLSFLMVTLGASINAAYGQNNCDGKLVYVDDPSSVKTNYPLFLQTSRNLYVLRGKCFYLSGGEFRGSITFYALSRAPKGFNSKVGTLFVKSIRTFSGDVQSRKIKVSRNDGWYLPDRAAQNRMSVVGPIDDRPIDISLADWNALHARSKNPEDFSDLGIPWHSYAIEDKTLYSTMSPDFWKVPASNDMQNRIVTNYLIRFLVNPNEVSHNPVPFYVVTPYSLQRIDLTIDSNVETLATQYTFLLK